MRRKEEVRLALAELIDENKQLEKNLTILIKEIDKVKSEEDYIKYDEKADKLTSGFNHIEIF